MGLGVNQLDQMQQAPGAGKDSGGGKTGSQGVITNAATSEQPSIGTPNEYANTVGLGDNQKQISPMKGKGKGA